MMVVGWIGNQAWDEEVIAVLQEGLMSVRLGVMNAMADRIGTIAQVCRQPARPQEERDEVEQEEQCGEVDGEEVHGGALSGV